MSKRHCRPHPTDVGLCRSKAAPILLAAIALLLLPFGVRGQDPLGVFLPGQLESSLASTDGYHIAGLQIILEQWGVTRVAPDDPGLASTALLATAHALAERGLHGLLLENVTIQDVEVANRPCLVWVDAPELGKTAYRTLVLARTDSAGIILIDPKSGNPLHLTRADVAGIWSGRVLIVSEEPPGADLIAGYMTGQGVQTFQERLRRLGLYAGAVDGVYGPQTQEAVRRLQSALGVAADGKAGPVTRLGLADFFASPAVPRLGGMQAKASFLVSALQDLLARDSYGELEVALAQTGKFLEENCGPSTWAQVMRIYDELEGYREYRENWDRVMHDLESNPRDALDLLAVMKEWAQEHAYERGVYACNEAMSYAMHAIPRREFTARQRGEQPDSAAVRRLIEELDRRERHGSDGTGSRLYENVTRALEFYEHSQPDSAIALLERTRTHTRWDESSRRRLLEAIREDDREGTRRIADEVLGVRFPTSHISFAGAYQLGSMALRSGDLQSAARHFEEARRLAAREGNELGVATCDWILPGIHTVLGHYDRAETLLDEKTGYLLRHLAEQPGLRGNLAIIQRDKAHLLVRTGRLQQAKEVLFSALQTYQASGDPSGQAGIHLDLADLYAQQNRVDSSRVHLLSAQRMFRAHGGPEEHLSVELRKARLTRFTGDLRGALAAFNSVAQTAQQNELPKYEARAVEGLAEIYAYLGSPTQSLADYSRAYDLDARYGSPRQQAASANNIGLLCLKYGLAYRDREAEDWLQESLAISRRTNNQAEIAASLVNMGHALLRRERLDDARTCFQEATEIYAQIENPGGRFRALCSTAVADVAAQRLIQAQEAFSEALELATVEPATQDAWFLYYGLSRMLEAGGDSGPAVVFAKMAVNEIQAERGRLTTLEETLQRSFLATKEHVYRHLANLLVDLGRLPEAREVLALLKEEEFRDFVTRTAVVTTAPSDTTGYRPEELTWWQQYLQISSDCAQTSSRLSQLKLKAKTADLSEDERQELARLQSELADAKRAFREYLEFLRVESTQDPQTARRFGERNLEELRAFQGVLRDLGPGTVMLHYLVTNDRLRIILTTADVQLARESSVGARELNREIARFRDSLSSVVGEPTRPGQTLYEYVLRPVEDALEQAGAKLILTSLDGTLRYVPMGALHDGQQYAIEKWQFVVFTEAAKPNLLYQSDASWRIAGMGVTKPHEGFTALPGVGDELDAIIRDTAADARGVAPGIVYLDDAFTLEAMNKVLFSRFPVMHIASHFRFGPGTEENSYLLLGDGSLLSLAAMIDMDIDFSGVDLLTLSACDTGVGESGADGREVEGFGALAQRQGARCVLATLWAVADQSTARLMEEMYRLRAEKPLTTKIEALRMAQLCLLSGECGGSYQHPFFWAPFILMGNWR